MTPKTFARLQGFTLVEIMIVVAIIALLAAIAVPNFMRARKRSQATTVLNDLRLIQAAVDQYAIDNGKTAGAACGWSDVQNYLKTGTRLYNSGCSDIFGNPYGGGSVSLPPIAERLDNQPPITQSPSTDTPGSFTVDGPVELSGVTFAVLSDVAPVEFWAPWTASSSF
jgi:prepilin-type N-terminal cleavage/methylation domain-containing protein